MLDPVAIGVQNRAKNSAGFDITQNRCLCPIAKEHGSSTISPIDCAGHHFSADNYGVTIIAPTHHLKADIQRKCVASTRGVDIECCGISCTKFTLYKRRD